MKTKWFNNKKTFFRLIKKAFVGWTRFELATLDPEPGALPGWATTSKIWINL